MATAGSIVIDLVMKTGLFETDTARAEKRLKELQKTAKQAGAVLGTALSVAGGALVALTQNSINNADAMRDLGIRLGTSTETLSAFGYAATQTGTDIDTLGRGMKILAKNAADALNPTSEQAKVFDALGIKVTDATGKLKDLSVLVPEIADKFAGMADGTTKAALAQALFGKAGLELTEFLNSGAKGLDEFTQRARDLGIVIGQDTADAADEFNDKLGYAKALVGGLGLAIAQELLPDLNNLISGFTRGGTAGDKLKDTAKDIADAFRFAADLVSSFVDNVQGLTFALTGAANALLAVNKASRLDFSGAAKSMRDARVAFDMAGDEQRQIENGLAGVSGKDNSASTGGRRGSGPITIRPVDDQAAVDAYTRKLQAALANTSDPKGGKAGRGGKSEAEKAADQLKAAHDRLNGSLDQQIALFNQTSEAAQLRYELETGELAKLEPTEKAALMAKAERLDQMDAELKLQQKLDDADKQRFESFTDVMGAIKEQTELVGMSADEQEVWNNLKWAGVSADSEWGKQIVESTKALQDQRDAMSDQIEAMDAIRDAGKGLFRDLIDDPANWKNAVMDALDSVQDRILDMIAENLMDQLFGKQGQPAGGSTGGWMSSLIGAFFGGAKAGGGDTVANRAYLVGEHGPEMFVPRTAGTVMTARETAGMGGGKSRPLNVTQVFPNAVFSNKKSESQRLQESGMRLRVASRNS